LNYARKNAKICYLDPLTNAKMPKKPHKPTLFACPSRKKTVTLQPSEPTLIHLPSSSAPHPSSFPHTLILSVFSFLNLKKQRIRRNTVEKWKTISGKDKNQPSSYLQ
jgi:hypothetical protein